MGKQDVQDIQDHDDEDDHHEFKQFYDVRQSIQNIETWPEKKKGYAELGAFFVLMLLYIIILALQLEVGNSYAIDSAFRNFLTNSPPGLANVFTQSDFWTYLIVPGDTPEAATGILPILFSDQWYNGDVYTTAEQGFILDYNKLVGGVLILQTRGVVNTDGCVSVLGPSSYSEFYPDCYLDTPDIKTSYNSTYINDLTDSFQYNPTLGGYSAFFGVADGRTSVVNRSVTLFEMLWTDKATRSISIKFAFYNGILGLFSFCAVSFSFDTGGIFTNGNSIVIQSINMEPYRGPVDFVRLTLEVIFMIWISQQVVYFLKSSYYMMMEIDKIRGVPRGFRALINLWSAVDAANLGLFITYIGFRCQVLWLIYSNPITVPTNSYQSILETIAAVQNQQLVVNFVNIFIGLLRFFRFYRFQAKLNVLNKTFENAFVDLYHFLIMFCVIFGGYGVMGHILFGPSVFDYSSVGRSLMTCWQILLGEFVYSEMEYVNADMAAVFFVTFMFLVVIVLVNILLAILIDAYTKATQDQEGMTILSEIGKGVVKGINGLRGHSRNFNDKHIIAALKKLQSKGNARVSAQEIGTIIAKSIDHNNATVIGSIVADHPLLDHVRLSEIDPNVPEPVNPNAAIAGYPLELIDDIERVLRENAYLRHRVQMDNE